MRVRSPPPVRPSWTTRISVASPGTWPGRSQRSERLHADDLGFRAVRPFLLLSIRAEDVAADDEYAAFLRFSGLDESRLRRIRLDAGPLPELDLDAYAGIILGGGPYNSSDAPTAKSAVQHRVER